MLLLRLAFAVKSLSFFTGGHGTTSGRACLYHPDRRHYAGWRRQIAYDGYEPSTTYVYQGIQFVLLEWITTIMPETTLRSDWKRSGTVFFPKWQRVHSLMLSG